MNKGYLSQYFESIAAKRLSTVEADTSSSNQHEYNGSKELKRIFGTEKVQFPTTFIWLGQENEALSSEGFVTWYDARQGHPSRSEFRLYYKTTEVSQLSQAGDLLIIAKRTNGSVLVIVAVAGSTIESQLLWLFNISVQTGLDFTMQNIQDKDDKEVDFAVRFILDELGIEIEEPEADYLDTILERYIGKLPSTKEFSILTRQTLPDLNPFEEPDLALMAWMDQEEKLFRRLERHEIDTRLQKGFIDEFGVNVEGFLQFSLSVQNRRKSRAGHALENHMEEILKVHKIKFQRQVKTENSKPDFIFPDIKSYYDPLFPNNLLTMLGVKTTCKDRWRQVLSEGAKIPQKHLLTLEPGISENQTDEMIASNLQLVIPDLIHDSYRDSQKVWLMNIRDFIRCIADKQSLIT